MENDIAKALEAATREMEESEAVNNDLDDIFWSSIHATTTSSSADTLDSIFYHSLVESDNFTLEQQDFSEYAPPSGAPVVAESPEAVERDTMIDQVAEYTIREVEKNIKKGNVAYGGLGDLLLFTNGANGVYMGKPQQEGALYDDPKQHMKNLLGMFYRGNKQELDQVAQHIIDNALKGTPVDVRKWLNR